jgi:hypothetical protein
MSMSMENVASGAEKLIVADSDRVIEGLAHCVHEGRPSKGLK